MLNKVRRCGSIPKFIEEYHIDNGIIYGCVKNHVPFVLTGSIRDDGPLPEVYANAYEGASAMRELVRKSTTVICLATMLHTIATGNMTPSFRVMPDGSIRPVYLYAVDAAEFVVNKLLDRGSLWPGALASSDKPYNSSRSGALCAGPVFMPAALCRHPSLLPDAGELIYSLRQRQACGESDVCALERFRGI